MQSVPESLISGPIQFKLFLSNNKKGWNAAENSPLDPVCTLKFRCACLIQSDLLTRWWAPWWSSVLPDVLPLVCKVSPGEILSDHFISALLVQLNSVLSVGLMCRWQGFDSASVIDDDLQPLFSNECEQWTICVLMHFREKSNQENKIYLMET